MFRESALRQLAAGVVLCGYFAGEEARGQEAIPDPSASAAAASVVERDGVSSYPPSFFAEFKSTSAYDMVDRIPGFSFNSGANVRGFGGAAGNVLIDGERPSSKTVDLRTILQRIPVDQVERIDLVRGGAPGIDMQGQAVVANVIRKPGAASSGAAQLLLKPFTDGYVAVIPRLEGAWRAGQLSLEGQVGGRYDRTFDWGDGPISRRDGDGDTVYFGDFDAKETQEIVNANAAAEYRPGESLLRLNGAVVHDTTRRRENSDLTDAAGRFAQSNFSTETDDESEIGADYTRPLGETLSLQLIGLATFQTSEAVATSRSRGELQKTDQYDESGERIARAVLTATPAEAIRLEAGAEGAFNFLDTARVLTVDGVRIALPSDSVRVEERRAEAFVSGTARLGPDLSLEGGARYERSTISQTGGANQEKTLGFLKPRLIVSWSPSAENQLRLRIEREVGQLNFNDFAASAELDSGTVNAGNPNLEPERRWLLEATFERRFWDAGALVLTLTHAEVEAVVDVIPIANRFDAPGNIGDGVRDSLRLSLNLPLERLGVPGGLAKFNGEWRRSEVTDPVTGEKRRASFDRPFEGDFLISKALPRLNSNIALEGSLGWEETAYRISEVRFTNETPFLKLYWDWTPRPDLIFRLQVENPTSKVKIRKRTLYAGPRSLGVVSATERREMRLDPFLMFRARKSF